MFKKRIQRLEERISRLDVGLSKQNLYITKIDTKQSTKLEILMNILVDAGILEKFEPLEPGIPSIQSIEFGYYIPAKKKTK